MFKWNLIFPPHKTNIFKDTKPRNPYSVHQIKRSSSTRRKELFERHSFVPSCTAETLNLDRRVFSAP